MRHRRLRSRLARARTRFFGRLSAGALTFLVSATILGAIGGIASRALEGDTSDILVRYAVGTTAEARAAAIATVDGAVGAEVAPLRMAVVTVATDSLDSALEALRADPAIESADPDIVREAQAAPNDPGYADQWALTRIGWDRAYGAELAGTSRLAILDTGVDANDPDLADRIVAGWSAFPDETAWFDPNGHGTALASIAASVTDNEIGIAGVAYGGVEIMPVQVLDGTGVGQDSDIIAGLVWAVDNGADVVLMGFSSPHYSQILQDAIEYAWSKDVVVVAATGNDGSDVAHFPAADAKVVGVGATDETDARWAGSNFGTSVFLAAPGTEVESVLGPVTGTSPAAALVAGAASLLRAVDPAASNGVVVGRLARNADPIGSRTDVGNGILDLGDAVVDRSTEPVVPVGGGPVGDGGPYVTYQAAAECSGGGTMSVQAPTSGVITTAGGTDLVLRFTTPGSGGCTFGGSSPASSNDSTVQVTIPPTPAGWSAPQVSTSSAAGYVSTPTSCSSGNNGGVASPAVSGSGTALAPYLVTVYFYCSAGKYFDLTYKAPIAPALTTGVSFLPLNPRASATGVTWRVGFTPRSSLGANDVITVNFPSNMLQNAGAAVPVTGFSNCSLAYDHPNNATYATITLGNSPIGSSCSVNGAATFNLTNVSNLATAPAANALSIYTTKDTMSFTTKSAGLSPASLATLGSPGPDTSPTVKVATTFASAIRYYTLDYAVALRDSGGNSVASAVAEGNDGTSTIRRFVVARTGGAVSFTDAGDIVTLNNHGLSNGRSVAFTSITSTTGISSAVTYYVVNATANTFQVAASVGGTALALTTNGTGTMISDASTVAWSLVTGTTATRAGSCPASPAVGTGDQDFVVLAGADNVADATSGTFSWTGTDTTTRTLELRVCGDEVLDAGEIIRLTLSPTADDATLPTAQTSDISITDDDTGVQFAITSGAGSTANEGSNTTFTVTPSGNASGTVRWSTSNGSASGASGSCPASASNTTVDFVSSSASPATELTFTYAQDPVTLVYGFTPATATITVPTCADSVYEASESFSVSLSDAAVAADAPAGATARVKTGVGTATGTITNTTSLKIRAYTVVGATTGGSTAAWEGNSSFSSRALRIQLVNASDDVTPVQTAVSLGVDFTVSGPGLVQGPQVVGNDYEVTTGGGVTFSGAGGTATVQTGNTYVDIPLKIWGDTAEEDAETLTFTVTAGSGSCGPSSTETCVSVDGNATKTKFTIVRISGVNYNSASTIIGNDDTLIAFSSNGDPIDGDNLTGRPGETRAIPIVAWTRQGWDGSTVPAVGNSAVVTAGSPVTAPYTVNSSDGSAVGSPTPGGGGSSCPGDFWPFTDGSISLTSADGSAEVHVCADTKSEPDSTLTLTLGAPNGAAAWRAVLGPKTTATVAVKDDDRAIGVEVVDDLDANGVKAAGEPGLNLIQVEIWQERSGSGRPLGLDIVRDGAGAIVLGSGGSDTYRGTFRTGCGDLTRVSCTAGTNLSGGVPQGVLSGLRAGTYYLVVRAAVPDVYTYTFTGSSVDNVNGDGAYVYSQRVGVANQDALAPTQVIKIVLSGSNGNISTGNVFLLARSGSSISGSIYEDVNGSGTLDGGETALASPSATVKLWRDGGNKAFGGDDTVIGTTTTDGSGDFSFTGLLGGTYFVEELATPTGYGATGVWWNDGSPTLWTGAKVSNAVLRLDLKSGQVSSTGNAFLVAAADSSISGTVWYDVYADHLVDGDDDGKSGATVSACRDDGDGLYETDGSDPCSVSSTSDETGAFSVAGLMRGTYFVVISPPAGFGAVHAVAEDDGTDDGIDVTYAAPGRLKAIVTRSGSSSVGNSFLISGTGRSIAWSVIADANGDGLTTGESGLTGGALATVTLYRDNPLGGEGEVGERDMGDILVDTVSSATGSTFSGLVRGLYFVVETNPEGWASTAVVAGVGGTRISDDELSVDLNGEATTRTGNTFLDSEKGSSISGIIYEDTDGDGQFSAGDVPLKGARIKLTRDLGLLADTVRSKSTAADAGKFSFTDLIAGGYTLEAPINLSGFSVILVDATGGNLTASVKVRFTIPDASTNKTATRFLASTSDDIAGRILNDADGNWQPGDVEIPMPNVWVQLLDASGAPVGSPIKTDAYGAFGFSVPGNAAGTYTLRATAPSGYGFTDPASGELEVVFDGTHPSGQNLFLLTRDDYTIGGTVYLDRTSESSTAPNRALNDVGTVDVPLAGVTVTLWRDKPTSGSIGTWDAGDTEIGTALTGEDGRYSFTTGVRSGTFFVVPSLAGYQPTGSLVDTVANADANDGVITSSVSDARLQVVISGSGDTAISTTGSGLLMAPAVGTISGQVIDDTDVGGDRDPGESVFAGATVQLYWDDPQGGPGKVGVWDAADILVTYAASTGVPTERTDTTGTFSWGSLVEGTYWLKETDKAGNYASTGILKGEGAGTTSSYKLQSSEEYYASPPSDIAINLNLVRIVTTSGTVTNTPTYFFDAAANRSISGKLFNDVNHDGLTTGDLGLAGKKVQARATINSVTSLVEATTQADGTFTISNLLSTTYRVQPENMSGTLSGTLLGWVETTPSKPLDVDLGGGDVSGKQLLVSWKNGTITGRVFDDRDGSTERNGASEAYLEGVEVKITSTIPGFSADPDTTDPTGTYSFSGLWEGTYTVEVVLPSGWTYFFPSTGSFDTTLSIASPTKNDPLVTYFGIQKASTIRYEVLEDVNADGLVDAVPSAPGATLNVVLYRDSVTAGCCAGDEQVGTALTSASGEFTGLRTGTYYLVSRTPSTWEATKALPATGSPNPTAATSTAKIVDTDYGATEVVKITISNSGANGVVSGSPTRNRFLITRMQSVTLSGTVKSDVDGNWTSSSGATDAAISGVRVEILLDRAPTGSYGAEDVVVYSKANGGTRAAYATTLADGSFSFGGLPFGAYYVRMVERGAGYDPAILRNQSPVGLDVTAPATKEASYASGMYRARIVAESPTLSYAGTNFLFARNDGSVSGFLTNDVANLGIRNVSGGGRKDIDVAGGTFYLYRETNGTAGFQPCAVGATTPACDDQTKAFPAGAPASDWSRSSYGPLKADYAFSGLLAGTYYLHAQPPTGGDRIFRSTGTNLAGTEAKADDQRGCFDASTCSEFTANAFPGWSAEVDGTDDQVTWVKFVISPSSIATLAGDEVTFFVGSANFAVTCVTDALLAGLPSCDPTATAVDQHYAGDTQTYVVEVTNLGSAPGPVSTPVDITIPAGTYARAVGANAGLCPSGGLMDGTSTVLACTTKPNQSLGAGLSLTYTIEVKYPSGWVASPLDTRSAVVSARVTYEADTDPVDDTDSDTNTVKNAAVLSVTETGPATQPDAGTDDLEYTIVVRNDGPSDARAVTLGTIVPAAVPPSPDALKYNPQTWDGATYCIVGESGNKCDGTDDVDPFAPLTLSSTLPLGTIDGESGTWTWPLDLPNETSPYQGYTEKTVVVRVLIPSGVDKGTQIASQPVVASTTSKPLPAAEGAQSVTAASAVTTTIDTHAKITVTKTGPLAAGAGDPVIYVISYTNDGPSDARNVVLSDVPGTNLGTPLWCSDAECAATSAWNSGAKAAVDRMLPNTTTVTWMTAVIAPATPLLSTVTNTATVTSDTAQTTGVGDGLLRSSTWLLTVRQRIELAYAGRLFIPSALATTDTRSVRAFATRPAGDVPAPLAPVYAFQAPAETLAATALSGSLAHTCSPSTWTGTSLAPRGWLGRCAPWPWTSPSVSDIGNYIVRVGLNPEETRYIADPVAEVVTLYQPVRGRRIAGEGSATDPTSASGRVTVKFDLKFPALKGGGTTAVPFGTFVSWWWDPVTGNRLAFTALDWTDGGLMLATVDGGKRAAFGGTGKLEIWNGKNLIQTVSKRFPFRVDLVQRRNGTMGLAFVVYQPLDPYRLYAFTAHEVGAPGTEQPFTGYMSVTWGPTP